MACMAGAASSLRQRTSTCDMFVERTLVAEPGRGLGGGRGRGSQHGSFNSMQANATAGQMAGMQLNSPGHPHSFSFIYALAAHAWQHGLCSQFGHLSAKDSPLH